MKARTAGIIVGGACGLWLCFAAPATAETPSTTDPHGMMPKSQLPAQGVTGVPLSSAEGPVEEAAPAEEAVAAPEEPAAPIEAAEPAEAAALTPEEAAEQGAPVLAASVAASGAAPSGGGGEIAAKPDAETVHVASRSGGGPFRSLGVFLTEVSNVCQTGIAGGAGASAIAFAILAGSVLIDRRLGLTQVRQTDDDMPELLYASDVIAPG